MTSPQIFALVTYTSDGYAKTVHSFRTAEQATRAARQLNKVPHEALALSQHAYDTIYDQVVSAGPRLYGERAQISPLRPGPVPLRPPARSHVCGRED